MSEMQKAGCTMWLVHDLHVNRRAGVQGKHWLTTQAIQAGSEIYPGQTFQHGQITPDHTLHDFLRASRDVSAGIEIASFEENNVPTMRNVMADLISRMMPS